ncbi:urea ABC transporter ATP-binding subunit UrtE [Sporolactobacillus terrae]|uniref:urea ABC transporter ATP-binding subunit UrtE n=1 Tax=Sporolactobacillus terrae TaxID=269673 RepID=UPI00111B3E41|nr:urea ABC transporter ATP-binding subunit UrtE [Sporolactobacillus terrae]
MLEIKEVSATYGEGTVLKRVNLKTSDNKITCLIGRNGAGKTTTLKSIMGLVNVVHGSICLDGQMITKKNTFERAQLGIGYVPQGRDIFSKLTVKENLLLGLEANHGQGTIPDYIFELFPILKDFLPRKGGDLSGGQQQQLAIARALVANPKILILDEPTEGIQPSIIQEISRVILKLKEKMTVLIVEQYLEFVLNIADYCYVMEKGQIVMDEEPNLLDKEKVARILSL